MESERRASTEMKGPSRRSPTSKRCSSLTLPASRQRCPNEDRPARTDCVAHPPRHYGPWEQITGLLADGLAQRGIDVPLFAALDSITLARLEGICARRYEEDDEIDGRVWEALHVAHALSRSAGFDLIDNHLDWLPLAFSGPAQAPMVTTIHGSSSPRILRACAHRSMPEVIQDGVTGVLADSVESAVAGREARGTARPGRVSPGRGAAVLRRLNGRLLPRCLRKGPS